MSQQNVEKLTPGATNGSGGTAHPIGRYTHKSLQMVIPGGSYLVQWSNDGNTWVDVGTARTADAQVTTQQASDPLPMTAQFIRIFTTTAASGVEFHLSGFAPS